MVSCSNVASSSFDCVTTSMSRVDSPCAVASLPDLVERIAQLDQLAGLQDLLLQPVRLRLQAQLCRPACSRRC
jgi:hypothetical protein